MAGERELSRLLRQFVRSLGAKEGNAHAAQHRIEEATRELEAAKAQAAALELRDREVWLKAEAAARTESAIRDLEAQFAVYTGPGDKHYTDQRRWLEGRKAKIPELRDCLTVSLLNRLRAALPTGGVPREEGQ